MDIDSIRVVAFDADDTLWLNEIYFREAEEKFSELMQPFLPGKEAINQLFSHEMKNLELYGYGIKGFTLSMVEAALEISKGKITAPDLLSIVELGKSMLNKPVRLLDDVDHIFTTLKNRYRLILATKGDLLDQERKLKKSGLEGHFHHTEVMSDKKEADYEKLIRHLDIEPGQFLMIGNSMKSDIIPVLNIGGKAIHIPHEITWQHEMVEDNPHLNGTYHQYDRLSDILQIL
ncbi:HAD family hydrolase [Fulvivirga sp. M361]|uniref:HAD family hydrolase n=1 Tax=Fulvivirga sp. M361 TaxID=2594266 RepID=UPI00117A174E|nr:HAD family hydrolase [Fulvivirga sp. M361]TRX48891.1 HAD family hydrolase [Fulvivirga sp. M361]